MSDWRLDDVSPRRPIGRILEFVVAIRQGARVYHVVMVSTAATGAGYTLPRAFTTYWRRAQELGDRSASGFTGGRHSVACRPVLLARSACAAVGVACGGAAGGAPPRPHPRTAGPPARFRDFFAGLAASRVRADSLRRDCAGGRDPASAVHHEADSEGADLGIDPGACRARNTLADLGRASGSAAARCRLRVQSAIAEPRMIAGPAGKTSLSTAGDCYIAFGCYTVSPPTTC